MAHRPKHISCCSFELFYPSVVDAASLRAQCEEQVCCSSHRCSFHLALQSPIDGAVCALRPCIAPACWLSSISSAAPLRAICVFSESQLRRVLAEVWQAIRCRQLYFLTGLVLVSMVW